MILENSDRRILGAIRFVDATTGLGIGSPLEVQASGVKIIRNRRGLYVIAGVPGVRTYQETFQQQPAPPAVGAVALESVGIELRVRDPRSEYMPRRATVRLPRDPAPDNADSANSLFSPVEVTLLPSPMSGVAPGWAVIRATVKESGTNRFLPWSLLRVMSSGVAPRVLALGQADNRGEALVAVPGIPITTFGEDEDVVATEIDVNVEVVFDPAVNKLDDLESLAGEGGDPNRGYSPDPDGLKNEEATDTFPFKLASGRILAETLMVDLNPP